MFLKSIDTNIDPCDDFYAHVCRNYVKNAVISDNQTRISGIVTLKKIVHEKLKKILEEDIEENEEFYKKTAKKAYKLCMDEEQIENDNLKVMKNYIKDFGGWPVLDDAWNESDFNLEKLLMKFVENGFKIKHLLNVHVTESFINSTRRTIHVSKL